MEIKKNQLWSIKQIAEELQLPKQRVYRYIKKECITESEQRNGVMYYDETVFLAIKSAFLNITASDEVHRETLQSTSEVHQSASTKQFDMEIIQTLQSTIKTLTEQLAVKDNQIAEKNKQIATLTLALGETTTALTSAQALHAGTIQHQLIETPTSSSDSSEKRGFFKRIFGKRT